MALRPTRPQSRSDQLAKRDAAQQDVFMREVDEALRQDEMLGAFKRYGRPIGAAILLGLTGLAGYLWWDHSQKQNAGEHGEQLTLALDHVEAGRLDTAGKELGSLTKDAGGGARAVAELMRGGIALQQGHKDEALKQFAAVSADGDAPQPYRDLAAVREVAANFEAMPPQQVVDRLKPLAIPGNPWFGGAGELVGMAYLKMGKKDLAGPLFAAISRDKDTPDTLRNRARQLAGLLGVDAIDDAAKAANVGQQ